jgi:hypothetical protein
MNLFCRELNVKKEAARYNAKKQIIVYARVAKPNYGKHNHVIILTGNDFCVSLEKKARLLPCLF